jgi:hypothetical protein
MIQFWCRLIKNSCATFQRRGVLCVGIWIKMVLATMMKSCNGAFGEE